MLLLVTVHSVCSCLTAKFCRFVYLFCLLKLTLIRVQIHKIIVYYMNRLVSVLHEYKEEY